MATTFLGLPTVTAGTLIRASDWNSMVNKIDAAIKKIMVVEKLVHTGAAGNLWTGDYDFMKVKIISYSAFESTLGTSYISGTNAYNAVELNFKRGQSAVIHGLYDISLTSGSITVTGRETPGFKNYNSAGETLYDIVIEYYKYEAISV